VSAGPAALRVLLVDHARGLGGAERSLLELLRALPASVEPTLATRHGALYDAAAELGIPLRVARLERLRSWAGPARLLAGASDLNLIARDTRADVVHANVYRAALYTSFVPAARGRMVWHVRDIHERKAGPRWLCRRATAVVANSEASRAALPCHERSTVVPNPIRQVAAAARSRADLGLPDGGPLVVNVGRLRPWKGQADFLQAAALVQAPAMFAVVGGRLFADGEALGYPDELVDLAERLGLRERVTFTGQREDVADMWPHVALLVHTARAEPFGRAVAEAQRAGVPVVAYADGGTPEVVRHGETGLLVPPGDARAVAAAVDALLADGERRLAMGAAARAAAVRFDPAAHAARLVEIWQSVARGRR
jgi:glycosyltransferase involved in cell wall biosynthesis